MTDRLNAMGADVTEALTKIAEEMDVSISELDFEVEREQFFNATGQAIGLDTIKVFAWKKQLINGLLEMKEWLEKTPLNIGRWAGNYAFFYVLNGFYRPKAFFTLST